MSLSIRKATADDAPALSHICLLTADSGKSAQHLHDYPELPGLVYSVPYVHLPTTWAFVLVDDRKEETVGYIVGSKDTRAYESYAAEHWWPPLTEKYPPELAQRPADARYMKLLRNMDTASEAILRFAAAHLHINILDTYQGQGWGKKLVATAIEYLKGENVEGGGIWLGIDPRNERAKRFYQNIGFREIEGADSHQLGIKFTDFI